MRTTLILSVIAAAGTAGTAWADPIYLPMPDQSVVSAEDFSVHFVASDKGQNPSTREDDYDWHGANIDTDEVVLLEPCWAGNYPFAGVHMTFEPGFWAAHLDQLRRHIERFVPDENYTGLIIVDYESWRPIWDRTKNEPGTSDPAAWDKDFKDDWREFARVRYADRLQGLNAAQKEEVFRETYEDAAREFFVRTIREIKRVRPHAKAGYFAIPVKRYGSNETPAGVIGYGNLSYTASQLNDRLSWVGDECDFVMPNVYGVRVGIPEGEPYDNNAGEAPAFRNAEYIYSSVAEARRMARGKPVYVIGSTRYWSGRAYPDPSMPMAALDMQQQFEYSRLAGASGLVLWHHKPTTPDDVFIPYVASTLGPIARAYNIHDADVADGLDPGAPSAPQETADSGDENDDNGKDDRFADLSPEMREAKLRELNGGEDNGKGETAAADKNTKDEPDTPTNTFTRTATTTTTARFTNSGAPKATGSTSSTKTASRVFTKNSANKPSKDEADKPGAPSKDADAKKVAEKKAADNRPARRWVYTQASANKSSDD